MTILQSLQILVMVLDVLTRLFTSPVCWNLCGRDPRRWCSMLHGAELTHQNDFAARLTLSEIKSRPTCQAMHTILPSCQELRSAVDIRSRRRDGFKVRGKLDTTSVCPRAMRLGRTDPTRRSYRDSAAALGETSLPFCRSICLPSGIRNLPSSRLHYCVQRQGQTFGRFASKDWQRSII